MPRDTRLLYVENDPVLRSMMSTVLSGLPGIEVVASVGADSAEEDSFHEPCSFY
jgi:CheY-like chemotaxis protein